MEGDFLESLDPEKTFFIDTEEGSFIFHLIKGSFYTRRTTSKEQKYCLVTKINGDKKYKEKDLDLGIHFDYVHPRLEKEVTVGPVRAIALR
ncbi:hypothetical protein HZA98_02530 [Candidatus Woesearchaeota archaeon]|nr:hypothetical protein [Candidatus Woesearchaeota archaeon]